MPEPTPKHRRPAALKLGWWLLGFLALAVLGVWLTNERSYARLQAYKQELAAKGEKLAVADHLPKLPPAASNAAPAFLAAAARLTPTKIAYDFLLRVFDTGRIRATWQCDELPWGDTPDLWPELIAHVESNRPALADIGVALERGELAFEWDYSKGFAMKAPDRGLVRIAVNELALATIVDLRSGHPNHAFAHWLALARLARLRSMPFGAFLRHAGVRDGLIALAVTWEALHFEDWSDAQLRQVQSVWQSWNVREAWLATANMERALMVEFFPRCRDSPSLLFMSLLGRSDYYWDPSSKLSVNLSENWGILKFRTGENLLLGLWRIGFSHDDELWTLRHRQVSLDEARAALAADAFGPARLRTTANYKLFHARHLMMRASSAMPWWEDDQLKIANCETARRITYTVIALSRHRSKHGRYPESLHGLVPEFLSELPRDFMNGQPLRYRLEADGRFSLWSVGDDLKDDGADPIRVPRSPVFNVPRLLDGRDWVWPRPATEAEVAAYHAELAARRSPAPVAP